VKITSHSRATWCCPCGDEIPARTLYAWFEVDSGEAVVCRKCLEAALDFMRRQDALRPLAEKMVRGEEITDEDAARYGRLLEP
jgi:hypothetical protein